jgi:hypothetical protein
MFVRLLEYLIPMDGGQFLDQNGRVIIPVRLVQIKNLQRAGYGEKQHARGNEEAYVGMPTTKTGGDHDLVWAERTTGSLPYNAADFT